MSLSDSFRPELVTPSHAFAPARESSSSFRYSIKTLFVFFAVSCIVFAFWATAANAQRRAVQAIILRGGNVIYGYQTGGGNGSDMPFPGALSRLLGKDYFSNVVRLEWTGPDANDFGLKYVAGLSHLQRLYLRKSEVTNEGLTQLEGLSRLETLVISDARITNRGLYHLRGLSHLQLLVLEKVDIDDAGLVHLQGLKSLTELYLTDTKVSSQGIQELREHLPNLKVHY